MNLRTYLQTIKGKFLKASNVNTDIRIFFFRNDEREYEKFEINIELPQGYVYTLVKHDDEAVALKEYEDMVIRIKASPKHFE